MSKPQVTITIIDDLLPEDDPIVVKLKIEYENVNLIRSPQKGLEYLKSNLDQKNIVLLDYLFGTNDPKGNDILKKIRETTVLIPVIVFTANGRSITEFPDLINNHAFAFVDKTRYADVIEKVKQAEIEIRNSLEGAIEEWIDIQDSSEREKPYLIQSDGKDYTLNEILKELRQQTEFGQRFEKDLLMLTIDLLLRKREKLDD